MGTSFRSLAGARVAGVDGDVGRVEDVLFDPKLRRAAFLVADTRTWWADRLLLVPLDLVDMPRSGNRVRLMLQKERIRRAPSSDGRPPLAPGMSARAATDVAWRAMAWGGYVGTLVRAPRLRDQAAEIPGAPGALRSTREALGHQVLAGDAELGPLRDVILGADWSVRGLVVDTGGWLLSERALVGYDATVGLCAKTRTVSLGLTRAEVLSGPRYDPSLSAEALEARLRAAEDAARAGRPPIPREYDRPTQRTA